MEPVSDDDLPDPQPVLPDDARRALDRIDAADLVVGIPAGRGASA